ncbi:MAG: thiamine phosphate synthase [Myxococcota bacterium]|nr:thiamine phosphate synthase [Myxococcota bacterium]MDW8361292.1 thiamine phosphate synthase [Myxococcales bacterium]
MRAATATIRSESTTGASGAPAVPALYVLLEPRNPEHAAALANAVVEGAGTIRLALCVRRRGAAAHEQIDLLRAAASVARPRSVEVWLAADPALARQAGADGAHLPDRTALGTTAARDVPLAMSVHDPAGLERAAAIGARFAVLAPIFEVPGKGPPLGLGRLARLVAGATLPVLALGGIGPEHVAEVLGTGAAGIAVLRGIAEATDPREAAARYAEALRIACGARVSR